MNPTLTLDKQVLWIFEINRHRIWLWIIHYCKLIQTWKGKHDRISKQKTHAHKGKEM